MMENTYPAAGGTASEAASSSSPLQCDVLVIGGGPAGSTAATLLAQLMATKHGQDCQRLA